MPLMRWKDFATRWLTSNPILPSRDMNKRQLNRALEDLNHATNRRFLRLEKLAVTPPLEPATMRWSVIRTDKTLAFAANLGPKPVDGIWTKWTVQGGRKLLRLQIVDGLKDGVESTFHPTGEKKSETLYRKGKQNGTFVAWGISGKKTQEGRYKDDKRDGLWIHYDQDGKGKSSDYLSKWYRDKGVKDTVASCHAIFKEVRRNRG